MEVYFNRVAMEYKLRSIVVCPWMYALSLRQRFAASTAVKTMCDEMQQREQQVERCRGRGSLVRGSHWRCQSQLRPAGRLSLIWKVLTLSRSLSGRLGFEAGRSSRLPVHK